MGTRLSSARARVESRAGARRRQSSAQTPCCPWGWPAQEPASPVGSLGRVGSSLPSVSTEMWGCGDVGMWRCLHFCDESGCRLVDLLAVEQGLQAPFKIPQGP